MPPVNWVRDFEVHIIMYAFTQRPKPNDSVSRGSQCRYTFYIAYNSIVLQLAYIPYACIRVRVRVRSSFTMRKLDSDWRLRLKVSSSLITICHLLYRIKHSASSIHGYNVQVLSMADSECECIIASLHRKPFIVRRVWCFLLPPKFYRAIHFQNCIIQLNFFLWSAAQLLQQRKLLSFSFNRKISHTTARHHPPHTCTHSGAISFVD